MTTWDTTVACRLRPGSELELHVLDRARPMGDPVAFAASTVMEVVRGLAASARVNRRAAAELSWLTGLFRSDLVEVLPFDHHAATVAGQIRALQPTPPTGGRRKGVKPEQRAGWILDIQIAACAWTHGRPIATDNARDFERLRDLIAELYPRASRLELAEPPAV